MRNDDLKDFFDEEAYNDLLSLYAEEETRKAEKKRATAMAEDEDIKIFHPSAKAKEPTNRTHAVQPPKPAVPQAPIAPPKPAAPRAPRAPKAEGGFKVQIEGLDEEFSAPVPQKQKVVPNLKKSKFAEAKQVLEDKVQEQSDAIIVKKNEEDATPFQKFQLFFFQNIRAFIVVIVCLVAAITISTYSVSCLNDIFAVRRDSETPIEVNIPPNADTGDVLKILKDNKLIKHRYFCHFVAALEKFKSDNYLTGIYYFTPSMGFERMLLNIKQPAMTGETITLTFPEGFTVDQIIAKLEEKGVCSAINIQQTMKTVDFSSEFSFIRDLDDQESRYHLLEGYMYPDTYDFYVNENPSSVIRKFLNNFQKKWTKEYEDQAKNIGMSVDDVITLASIIQKEAYGADQSPLVSSVLHNRLDKPSLYPSLQCDSTTEYINEYIKKNVGSAAQLDMYTSKYSSYKCEGLPVGAICNPGDDAIKAALNPRNTNYYFFAHDVNKKIYMARNDAERRSNNIAILNANSKAEKEKNQ